MEYIILIYIVLLTVAQYVFGYVLTAIAQQKLFFGVPAEQIAGAIQGQGKGQPNAVGMIPFYWLFGLLLHLSLIFVVKILGANWWLASLLPFLLMLFCRNHILPALSLLRSSIRCLINGPFLVWLGFHVFLGYSLFSVSNGIYTPWVNNYGDLTFHLGMIHHFQAQGEFPPQYHIYAGETLSYPYFVNLWATVLWNPIPFLLTLSVVFAAQWVLLWSCVYAMLTQGKGRYLPWLMLFGGGSLFAVFSLPGEFSWKLINEGYPWTTWLSTIWVTQRSALMGMVICLASCSLVLNVARIDRHGVFNCALAGVLLGLSPLVHTHFFVVTALFLGGYLSLSALPAIRRLSLSEGASTFVDYCKLPECQKFLFLFFLTCISVAFFPLLMGKSSMASLMLGWAVPVKNAGLDSLAASALMWLTNALPWLACMAVVWCFSKSHLKFVLLFALFLLGNIVKLATWDWDQLKFFLAVFTVFIVVWRSALPQMRTWKSKAPNYALALILLIPGVYEFGKIWRSPPNYQVYDLLKLELAQIIMHKTSKDAIIASPSDHNSAATISGRTLFYGYPGTLASHSLDYKTREDIQMNLFKISRCKEIANFDRNLCPTHLIWDAAGRKYWHRVRPADGFKEVFSIKNGEYGLYEIVGSEEGKGKQ